MEYTGERLVPGVSSSDDETEHLVRYLACREAVQGLRVLDAACGEGYGTDMLASTAAAATGLDIDKATIEGAAVKYPHCQFACGSIAQMPFDSGSFDAVVSFETLEHVDEATQRAFIAEIARVLVPGGFLIMSTPDKHWATDVPGVVNEFHIHELYEPDFVELLRTSFENVDIYYQNLWVYSEIGRPKDGRGSCRVSGRPEWGQNLIAVCSDTPSPPLIDIVHRSTQGYRAMKREMVDRREVEAIRESISWRVTAPLRWIRSRFVQDGRDAR